MEDDDVREKVEKEPSLEHVGFEAQRVVFAQSPMAILERVFAFCWMEENNQEWCVLDKLVYNQHDDQGATQRDAEVAATVIQWLGTAVGYSFLARCLKEAGFKIEPPR